MRNKLNIQGKVLRHLREQGNLTQAGLAWTVRTSNTTVSDMENGRRKISSRLRPFFADQFEIDEGLLLVAGAVDDSPHLDFITMGHTDRQMTIRLMAARYLCSLDAADVELLVGFIREAARHRRPGETRP